jgi:stearoyl-CoA desaturase (delta-9 desaturase)
VALLGVVLTPVPGVPVFAVTVGLAVLGSLGTTVAYHRALAHRALRLNPVLEQVLIFFALINGSSSPRVWVSKHRLHHAKADTVEDVSSPRFGGFWWAHLFWLYQVPDADDGRWSPDLHKTRYDLWTRLQPWLVALSMFGGLAFGWKGLFWIGGIRLVYMLHMQCLVNSLTHMGPISDETNGDSSINVWWLGPFQLAAWGENWHRNHHADQNSARFGWSPGQIDVGWLSIRLFELLGLADRIRTRRRDRPALAGT